MTVTAAEFEFSPSTISAPVGQPIAWILDNKGVIEHDVFGTIHSGSGGAGGH